MNDQKEKEYNHPAYVNIPYFVLQDKRLDFFNKLLFSFFWSFSVSGRRIKPSNGYLADLFQVTDKYIQARLKELEDFGFIRRSKIKYKRIIEVLYVPYEDIEMETDRSDIALVPTVVGASIKTTQKNRSKNILTPTTVGVSHQPQLVPPPTTVGVYNKEDTKEDTKANKNPKGDFMDNTFLLTPEDMLKDNPHNIPEQMINEWVTLRKRKKAPVTQTAWTRTNKVMSRLVEDGLEAQDCFERMVANGWQGLEYKYFEQELKAKPVLKYPTADERAVNEVKIRERELKAQEDKRKEIDDAKVFKTIENEAKKRIGLSERLKLYKMDLDKK